LENYAEKEAVETAYQQLSGAMTEGDAARRNKLDEAYGVLTSRPRKIIYDAHLERDKQIDNPLMVKFLSVMGFRKHDTVEAQTGDWKEVVSTPFAMFDKWFPSTQLIDHQDAVKELGYYTPIGESDNPEHQQFKEAYEEVVSHEDVTDKSIPLYVWNDPSKYRYAFLGRDAEANQHIIAFDEKFLETLDTKNFSAVAAHELGHAHDPVKGRKATGRALNLLKLAQHSSKNVLFPVLTAVGIATGATPLVGISLGLLAGTTALYTTGKAIVQKINHQEEYNADAFSAKITGIDTILEQLQKDDEKNKGLLKEGGIKQSWEKRLFGQMSHPTFEQRMDAVLRFGSPEEVKDWQTRIEDQSGKGELASDVKRR